MPYVEDRRNILIVRPHYRLGELEAETLTTLQYALKRGIEKAVAAALRRSRELAS